MFGIRPFASYTVRVKTIDAGVDVARPPPADWAPVAAGSMMSVAVSIRRAARMSVPRDLLVPIDARLQLDDRRRLWGRQQVTAVCVDDVNGHGRRGFCISA